MTTFITDLLVAILIIGIASIHVSSAFPVVAVGRILASTCVRLDAYDDPDVSRRRQRHRNLEHWGVERLDSLDFPSSFEQVADEVFDAIAGTMCGLQRPDPNVASNAMHQSVLDYRPTHPLASSKRRWLRGDDFNTKTKISSNKEQDIPLRMGVEIDGAACLSRHRDEGRAMRILSLHIAKRLSTSPWENVNKSSGRVRSVAIYFNSVEQSLLASRELSRWRESAGNTSFIDMHIYCLGQDSLQSKGKRQLHESAINSIADADPKASIILVVKPTDYDATSATSYHPTIQPNVVDKLQTLLFQAAASGIPAIVLSPRLSELPPLQHSSFQGYKRTGPSGFEQSGFQRSSTYGGVEPPVGPTSWLLRDLVPPIYVWVGCAYNIHGDHLRWRSIAELHRQQQFNTEKDEGGLSRLKNFRNENNMYSFYSRVALRQSAMDPGHSWHMFAVKERLNRSEQIASIRIDDLDHTFERDVSYHYIGSTVSARGRPNSRIMCDVLEEFIERNDDSKR